jgi:hypothetical protein
MKAAANGIGFHPYSDEIVRVIEVEGLGVSEGHG